MHLCIQDTERIVGCTGSPADSHDLLWFNLKKDKLGRCTECGSGNSLAPCHQSPADIVFDQSTPLTSKAKKTTVIIRDTLVDECMDAWMHENCTQFRRQTILICFPLALQCAMFHSVEWGDVVRNAPSMIWTKARSSSGCIC